MHLKRRATVLASALAATAMLASAAMAASMPVEHGNGAPAQTFSAAENESPAVPPPPPLQALDFTPFEEALRALEPERLAELDTLVIEATITELQAAMQAGELSSVELATYYLARIRRFDVDGSRSMLELNPAALAVAADLDAERAAGTVRGPLHGIPISLKGNIATGDGMHNTAGAAAMAESQSDEDATVAALLRDAGALILGKANMSEWAYWMHSGPSGYTALGGQVVNPYGPEWDPLGSSTGSAVGTSANLVAASIGTETLGSIIAPSAVNGVVGMYPSRGLVSRSRVIPVTDQTDTPGPIARNVRDTALLLTAIVGQDPQDSVTSAAAELAGTDFTSFLDANVLEGIRVGVFTRLAEPLDGFSEADTYELFGMTAAINGLEAAGAEVVPIWSAAPDNTAAFISVGNNGLRLGLADYIATVDPDGPISSIADVVAFNEQDPGVYAPFGQQRLIDAAASDLTPEDYEALGSRLRGEARTYIDELLTSNDVDVIASSGNAFSGAYAVAGYPAVTVPAGRSETQGAIGLTFSGPHLSDGELLGYAYAFEQATGLRVVPEAGAASTSK
jgi:amidase